MALNCYLLDDKRFFLSEAMLMQYTDISNNGSQPMCKILDSSTICNKNTHITLDKNKELALHVKSISLYERERDVLDKSLTEKSNLTTSNLYYTNEVLPTCVDVKALLGPLLKMP